MAIKLMKFGAKWCPPCKLIDPEIEKFKATSLCEVESVDVDEHPEVAQNFNVETIPTLIWLDDSLVLERQRGVKTTTELVSKFKELKNSHEMDFK